MQGTVGCTPWYGGLSRTVALHARDGHGCRGGGPEMADVRRGGGLGQRRGGSSMGQGFDLAQLWVVTMSGRGGRVIGPVGASQRGWLDGTSGRRPRAWCDGRGLRAVVLCSSGYVHMGRAALQLEDERCYVGVAAPEGGVGGVCRAYRSGGCRGGGPESFAAPVEARLVLSALLRLVSGFVLACLLPRSRNSMCDDG